MRVLIVEDEALASERLNTLLKQYDNSIDVVTCLDSVEETVEILSSKDNDIDLLFLDIQLSDGTSFEIFKQVNVAQPVIFTTAYDQFALQAFKHNSIDYLLKPIDFTELTGAINKYKKIHWDKKNSLSANPDLIQHLLQGVNQPNIYKKRFIVKYGDHIQFKQVEDVGYFYADGKTVYLVLKENNRKYIIDHTLEELENKLLNPEEFFRINRKFILSIDAIKEVNPYFNSRLKVHLNKGSEQDLIVSRERVNEFKLWLNL